MRKAQCNCDLVNSYALVFSNAVCMHTLTRMWMDYLGRPSQTRRGFRCGLTDVLESAGFTGSPVRMHRPAMLRIKPRTLTKHQTQKVFLSTTCQYISDIHLEKVTFNWKDFWKGESGSQKKGRGLITLRNEQESRAPATFYTWRVTNGSMQNLRFINWRGTTKRSILVKVGKKFARFYSTFTFRMGTNNLFREFNIIFTKLFVIDSHAISCLCKIFYKTTIYFVYINNL